MTNANTKKALIIKAEALIEQWLRHGCTFAESYAAWEESTTAGRQVKEAVKANFEDYGYTL